MRLNAEIRAPSTMNGFRRPQRDRKLSDSEPTTGSVTASHSRGIAVA